MVKNLIHCQKRYKRVSLLFQLQYSKSCSLQNTSKKERIYIIYFRNDVLRESFVFPTTVKLEHFLKDFLLPDYEVQNLIIERDYLKLNDNIWI